MAEHTFVGLPSIEQGTYKGAAAVVLGADHGSPYKQGVASHAAGARQRFGRVRQGAATNSARSGDDGSSFQKAVLPHLDDAYGLAPA